MAGAYDMDEPRKTAGKKEIANQKQYTSEKKNAKSMLSDSINQAKKTAALANKKGDASQKKLANDSLKSLLDIQPVFNKLGENATDTFEGDTGSLNFGKASDAASKDKAYKDAYERIKAENPNWWDENVDKAAKEEVDAQFGTNAGTNGSNGGSGNGNKTPSAADKATSDAFSMLAALFTQYNLGSLSDTITRMMKMGLTAQEATVKLKYDTSIDKVTGKAWNAAYTLRFTGNEKRKASGLNAISEAEYLSLEDSYAETLKAYGLGNMLNTDRTINEAKFAEYIGNDMSTVEFKDRIATVSDRVINADPAIKAAFKQWYPNLTDQDLVQYFLSPNDTLPKLKEKATAAEIGGAAIGQGLGASKSTAEDLARYGIDRGSAIQGYANIAEVLPTAQKLGDIYQESGIKYDQASGESEFFKNNQSDAAKRKRLKSMERAQFSGASGFDAQTTFGKSIEGQY